MTAVHLVLNLFLKELEVMMTLNANPEVLWYIPSVPLTCQLSQLSIARM